MDDIQAEQQLHSEIESVGSSSGSDELLPQPAFDLTTANEIIEPQQQEAFDYIYFVRAQKSQILTQQRANRRIHDIPLNAQESSSDLLNSSHRSNGCLESQTSKRNSEWIKPWAIKVIQDWRVVIANVRYAKKHSTIFVPLKSSRIATNDQIFNRTPIIDELFRVPLPEIERNLSEISNLYINFYQIQGKNMRFERNPKAHYQLSLWVYSLLAVHQSQAAYTNFQALGAINAAIQTYCDYIRLKGSPHCEETNHLAVNLVLLVEIFHQRNLNNCFEILGKMV